MSDLILLWFVGIFMHAWFLSFPHTDAEVEGRYRDRNRIACLMLASPLWPVLIVGYLARAVSHLWQEAKEIR